MADLMRWWRTEMGAKELARVATAIQNCHISQGPVTRQFEERLAEYLGVPYVVCTTSGTTALTMALMAAGVGPGDEVIVPDITWIASAHAVLMTGAKVALVDVEKTRPLINISEAYVKRTEKTKAIMPVHLNGRIAAGEEKPENYLPWVPVIEDAAQCIGSRYPEGDHLGTRGAMGAFSLSIAKLISTGQGGFVCTRDEGAYRELKAIRTHAIEDVMVPKVLEWKRPGFNFRFTDIQAAIGLAQLDERLPERIERTRAIYERYAAGLPSWLPMLHVEPPGVPIYIEVLHPASEAIRVHLHAAGIEARPFHPPLHTAPYLMPDHRTGYHDYQFPNAMKYVHGLVLPCGPSRTDAEIDRVLNVLHAYQQ